jgi:hypothetical protein
MARASAGRKRAKRTPARKSGRAAKPRRLELGLIGIDVRGEPSRVRARALIPLVGIALLAALSLASLRIDLLRIRYAVAEANDREQVLQAEQRALTANMRSLRDPVTLTRRADELGFVRPERLIDLPGDGTTPASAPDRTPDEPPSFVEEAVAVLADASAHTLRSWSRNP